jgi:hypothetical protein
MLLPIFATISRIGVYSNRHIAHPAGNNGTETYLCKSVIVDLG